MNLHTKLQHVFPSISRKESSSEELIKDAYHNLKKHDSNLPNQIPNDILKPCLGRVEAIENVTHRDILESVAQSTSQYIKSKEG